MVVALEAVSIAPTTGRCARQLRAVVSPCMRGDIWNERIGNVSLSPVTPLAGALTNESCDASRIDRADQSPVGRHIWFGWSYGARLAVDFDVRRAMERRIGCELLHAAGSRAGFACSRVEAVVGSVPAPAHNVGLPAPTIGGIAFLLRVRTACPALPG